MRDRFGRNLTYLRVSVTDRCDMRCVYCMPECGVPLVSHNDLLTFEEIERVVRVGVGLGIRAVRLTGGEPLMRRGIVGLVERLGNIEGIEDLSMTTNGLRLGVFATQLKAAGLRRVNVSLDSLSPGTYAAITRGGDLSGVLEGVDRALETGLGPVKVNCVPLRGLNDCEIPVLLEYVRTRPIHLRFIELMPVGWNDAWFQQRFMPASEVRSMVETVLSASGVKTKPSTKVDGRGPATYLSIEGYQGTVGFISAITGHFCARCSRMRLTSTGKLSPCLASPLEVDVRGPLRDGCDDARIRDLFMEAVSLKPQQHDMESAVGLDARMMSKIGG